MPELQEMSYRGLIPSLFEHLHSSMEHDSTGVESFPTPGELMRHHLTRWSRVLSHPGRIDGDILHKSQSDTLPLQIGEV